MKKLYVPPRGSPAAKLAICGEQPGVMEVRHRPPTPFVGPAGEGLNDCLRLCGVARSDVWLTNVIKDLDAPLDHYINLSKGKWSISQDGWSYIHELKEELTRLKPNAIVAMGNIALLALTNRVGITKWRGSILESTLVQGLKVIPTFHPATFIPPKFNFLNKPLICFDLKKAIAESKFPELHTTPREVKIKPSFGEAVAYLNYALEAGKKGVIIDFDIEVVNEELDCFSIAFHPDKSISIPFRDSRGDYFNPEQELEIMRLLATILEAEDVQKRGANIIFDTQFVFSKYGIRPRGDLHCTQIAQKIAFPDYNAGLDFVTSMHTDIAYYKEDGKKWVKMGLGSWEQWWTYNGMDAIATASAHPSQIEDLTRQGNIETYNRQRRLIKPLIYMMERGIRVDVEGLMRKKEEEQKQLGQLSEELNKIVGYEINFDSPKQLANYFYEQLRIPPYKKRNTQGKYVITTDVDALKRIVRNKGLPKEANEAARLMLDIRSLSKRISTYMDIGKVDKDGRYRSSYKPVGAETGRLSSGETIFGTGGNQQNWPHDLLRYFLFDEGYIGYSIDLSQIENRIVAYVGGIIPMIEAFEGGIDVHTLTASLIFSKPYDKVSNVEGSCTLGDGRQSERFWGKKANHGLNYDLGYKTFALKYEITETEAKWMVERYHQAYPGVRQGYHAMIQAQLRKDRTLTNLFGRKRIFLGPVVPNPPLVPASACHVTYKEAYAHIPQSTTADKINEQGVEYIYYNQNLFKPVELLAQIHDSIVFQIPASVPIPEHALILKRIKDSLEKPVTWRGTEIKTPADISIGLNMCKEEMTDIKSSSFPSTIYKMVDTLREIHGRLRTKTE